MNFARFWKGQKYQNLNLVKGKYKNSVKHWFMCYFKVVSQFNLSIEFRFLGLSRNSLSGFQIFEKYGRNGVGYNKRFYKLTVQSLNLLSTFYVHMYKKGMFLISGGMRRKMDKKDKTLCAAYSCPTCFSCLK